MTRFGVRRPAPFDVIARKSEGPTWQSGSFVFYGMAGDRRAASSSGADAPPFLWGKAWAVGATPPLQFPLPAHILRRGPHPSLTQNASIFRQIHLPHRGRLGGRQPAFLLPVTCSLLPGLGCPIGLAVLGHFPTAVGKHRVRQPQSLIPVPCSLVGGALSTSLRSATSPRAFRPHLAENSTLCCFPGARCHCGGEA